MKVDYARELACKIKKKQFNVVIWLLVIHVYLEC